MQYSSNGGVNTRRLGFALPAALALSLFATAALAASPPSATPPVPAGGKPAGVVPTPPAPVAQRGTPAVTQPPGTAAAARGAAFQVEDVGGRSAAHAADGHASTATPLPAQVHLFAGQAVVHRVPSAIRRVAVGNGEVLTVHTVGSKELVLIATLAGQTSLHLWLSDGTQRDVPVSVAADSGDATAAMVRTLLGDVPGLSVTPVGGNVVIAGKEVDQGTAQRIAAIQKLYPQVLNFASADAVGMRPMVLMDVQIFEFNRNALEDLGIRWDRALSGPLGGIIKDFTTNPYFRVLPSGNETFQDIKDTLPPRLPGTNAYFGIASTLGSTINLLMSQGKAWLLASPQLSVRSGSEATFLAGGEVPIVVPSVLGVTQIEYKEYGVRLNIQPTVNDNGEVLTSVMAEVSRIDPSVSVQGVPGFLTRRTQSEINVHTGETIVISGLLDRTASKAADKFPLLGDLPIIGKLFRSDAFRGQRTELVAFVTPRVISPDSPENRGAIEHRDAIDSSLDNEISKRQRKLIRPVQ